MISILFQAVLYERGHLARVDLDLDLDLIAWRCHASAAPHAKWKPEVRSGQARIEEERNRIGRIQEFGFAAGAETWHRDFVAAAPRVAYAWVGELARGLLHAGEIGKETEEWIRELMEDLGEELAEDSCAPDAD